MFLHKILKNYLKIGNFQKKKKDFPSQNFDLWKLIYGKKIENS
jgi:hypothetical protein